MDGPTDQPTTNLHALQSEKFEIFINLLLWSTVLNTADRLSGKATYESWVHHNKMPPMQTN